jgi:fucose permease
MKKNPDEVGTSKESVQKRQRYLNYIYAVCTVLVGYFVVFYLMGRFSLMEYLCFVAGCFIMLLLVVAFTEIRERSK